MKRASEPPVEAETMRLDKWLWSARFYKTRQLAAEAISGGKVHLNGHRTKPGKDIRVGSQLHISKGSLEWDIEIAALSKQRRPASEARNFYTEPADSIERRELLVKQQREERAMLPHSGNRKPGKRDRRLIHRFKNASS